MNKEIILSPCVRGRRAVYCQMKNGLCIGCKRNDEEITYWRIKTSEEKKKIWKNILERGFEPLPGFDLSFLEQPE